MSASLRALLILACSLWMLATPLVEARDIADPRTEGWPRTPAVPGGLVLPEVPADPQAPDEAPTVTFEGQRVLVLRRDGAWIAVVGLPLARAPGAAAVQIRHRSTTAPSSATSVENSAGRLEAAESGTSSRRSGRASTRTTSASGRSPELSM